MALFFFFQPLALSQNPNSILPSISYPKSPLSKIKSSSSSSMHSTIQCNLTTPPPTITQNRSKNNFQPSVWQHDYIQSLKTGFMEESSHTQEITKLVEEIKLIFSETSSHPLHQLELIDTLQRLGVGRHFTSEISSVLQKAYKNVEKKKDLYSAALEFRLLRQHGYAVSSEILKGFKDGMDSENVKSILSLYEASFLSVEGERVLDEVGELSRRYLKEFAEKKEDEEMVVLVEHALEIPLHWRTPRVECRWFIHFYETHHHNMNHALLKLAILDFNMVQLKHVHDLKHASRLELD